MTSSELIRDGWFGEKEALWPGQRFCLRVKQVLYEATSAFQNILVFDSTDYGRVLVLDGVIQLTERDECAYQEMIAHLPLFSHPDPRRVLIVGGGDGGVLREVVKHGGVEHITMCEIDPEVVATSKRFFPDTMATAFGDPRLSLVHADAAAYVKDHEGEFDVVIVDSSDPVGPAESLFENAFYRGLRASLRPSGVICTQGECMWLHLDIIGRVMEQCGPLFAAVDYAYTTVPTYPSGQIGFILCSNDPAAMAGALSYYTPAAHRAAFTLPAFAERQLARWRKRGGQACCQSLGAAAPALAAGAALGACAAVAVLRYGCGCMRGK